MIGAVYKVNILQGIETLGGARRNVMTTFKSCPVRFRIMASWFRAGRCLVAKLGPSAVIPRALHSSRSLRNEAIDPRVWALGRLHHVGVAVPDVNAASKLYKETLAMGDKVSEVRSHPEHGIRCVFIDFGNSMLELIEPLGEASPLKGFIDRNKGGGLHHICLEVNDLDAAARQLSDLKIHLLSPKPRPGAHGKDVLFLHPKDCQGVLVELQQA
uniref:methylmalonyl-CoA epimerase, mitochondrial n=1 Tax=Myxine glutinosa TaxID=7769 RepID=UPI00358F3BB8